MSETGKTGAKEGRLAEEIFRRAAGRVLSRLVRVLGPGHAELAEDSLSDAFAAALETWPFRGVPDAPEAWLMTVARNKAIDRLRRHRKWAGGGSDVLDAELASLAAPEPEDESFPDDHLKLMFVCCDPALPEDAQIALSLKLVCGFSNGEIARLTLAGDAAIEQRLTRAKAKIRELGLKFDPPDGEARTARRQSVLRVLYLLFTAGHATGGGEAALRRDLAMEALRLARALAGRKGAPGADLSALLALFCFQAAHFPARGGDDVLLLASQDRKLWDQALIAEGFAHLKQAMTAEALTVYHIEAGVAAVHAAAPSDDATDWAQIRHYYDLLGAMTANPVVRLNQAVAILKTDGPEAALDILAGLAGEAVMQRYPLYHAVHADVLRRLGRMGEAGAAFEAALALPLNSADRRLLERRRAACKAAAHDGSVHPI